MNWQRYMRNASSIRALGTPTNFANLLAMESTAVIVVEHAFAMLQIAAETCEILTIAVARTYRRRGLASRLICQAKKHATAMECRTILLEVAENNAAARALYTKCGFKESAIRKNYYRQHDGKRVSARVLTFTLDGHQAA